MMPVAGNRCRVRLMIDVILKFTIYLIICIKISSFVYSEHNVHIQTDERKHLKADKQSVNKGLTYADIIVYLESIRIKRM